MLNIDRHLTQSCPVRLTNPPLHVIRTVSACHGVIPLFYQRAGIHPALCFRLYYQARASTYWR